MPRRRVIRLQCPICKKPVKSTETEFPFCSKRCRLMDLGKWASGEYVISSPVKDTSDSKPEGEPPDPDEKPPS